MPLDGHGYLTRHGWKGKGTALREGGISRPVIISQKKTLSGLGKDRDEAFPFWDHVFAAAASAIKVEVPKDDDDEEDEKSSSSSSSTAPQQLQRTSTGIISNRRPTILTPVPSGSTTPLSEDHTPRVSLLSLAKREAARRGLYSRFLRGEVIKPLNNDLVVMMSVEGVTMGVDKVEKVKKKRKRKVDDADAEKTQGEEARNEDADESRKKNKKKRNAVDEVDISGDGSSDMMNSRNEGGSEETSRRKRKREKDTRRNERKEPVE